MLNADEEKDMLTKKLSEQYAQNTITIEEYERMLEYINKIETRKEITIVEKIIQEQSSNNAAAVLPQTKDNEKHLSMFSWRTSNIKPVRGNGGTYISLFGTNRIIVDNLPKGKTILNVNSIFGLTEIIVSKNIKIVNRITPLFSGVFAPDEINKEDEDLPELYLVGKAFFGNITIKR